MIGFIIAVLFIVLLIFTVKWTIRDRRDETVLRAASQTKGEIIRCNPLGDDLEGFSYLIRYTVDGVEYKIREYSGEEPEGSFSAEVTVHYDPADPKCAWAETPTVNNHMASVQPPHGC